MHEAILEVESFSNVYYWFYSLYFITLVVFCHQEAHSPRPIKRVRGPQVSHPVEGVGHLQSEGAESLQQDQVEGFASLLKKTLLGLMWLSQQEGQTQPQLEVAQLEGGHSWRKTARLEQ